MVKRILILILIIFPCIRVFSQDTTKTVSPVMVVEGDTVAMVDVRAVVIFPPHKAETRRDSRRYDKLVNNVKKVYPYAKLAGKMLTVYKNMMDTIPSEKARKILMKKAQKELEDQFGDEIRELTFSQGKVLIKLVYRETGHSTFDIVKELRGGFAAFIWQSLARVFGYDLKEDYDPGGDDQVIEQIVLMIEAGAI